MMRQEELYKDMTIGEMLKSAREKLNIDYNFVSSALRVKTKDIIALEEDNANLITSHLYLVGFIKSYAKLVKINEAIVEEKIKKLSISSNTDNKNHNLLIEEEDVCSPDRETFFHAILLFVILYLILFCFDQFKAKDMVTSESIINELNNL
jgi:cytoskeletal protein RodZ